MRQLYGVALLVGCGFQHGIVPGDASAQDGRRVDTPLIDAPIDGRPIDAPVDAGSIVYMDAPDAPPAGTDTDGDGVPDATDNCPTKPNADQRDHDGDARGDVCDLCPHLASATDPDGDGDGVGDACDPRPAAAGDQRVLWEGFYDASSISGWTTNNGTWSVANGMLTQASTSAGVSTIGPATTWPRVQITAGVLVNAFGMPSFGFDNPAVSVAGAVAQNGQIYYCSAVEGTQNGNRIYSTVLTQLGLGGNNVAWPGTLQAGSQLRLVETITSSNMGCEAIQATTTATVPNVNISNSMGAVRASTTTESASFDYLFVVSIGA